MILRVLRLKDSYNVNFKNIKTVSTHFFRGGGGG
jgi:hypothetical protein